MNLLPEDLNYIVNRLPTDVRKLMKKGNIYLAGGFIRSCIANEQVNDIDLWGADAEQLKVTAQLFAGERKVRCMMTDNACTILTNGRTPVQFITRWTYDDPVKLAESLDYSIASAVIWYERADAQPADGSRVYGQWKSHCHENFYADLASKRLRYLFPVRNEDAGGSMLRMTKFLARGYRIAPESLAGLIARMNSGIKYDDFLTTDERHQTKVYAGLLREVDPLTIVDGCEVLGAEPEEEAPVTGEIDQFGELVSATPAFINPQLPGAPK